MICNPARYLFFLLIFLTWTSCKTATPTTALPPPNPKGYVSEADKAFIADFAKKLNLTHLFFDCRIYDINGTLVATFNGRICLFENNGNMLVANSRFAIFLDHMQRAVWVKNGTFLHHSLKKSQFRDEYLALASEYLGTKEWPSVRYDELVVIGKNGTVLKNFKFSKYDQTNPLPRPPQDDYWSVEKEFQTKEFTHGNSFSELWTTKNGRRIHTGYVYYGNTEDFVYLFSPSLKKITAKLKVDGHKLHSVHQYNDNKLIAYGNTREKNSPGGIFLIDKKSGAVERLYKFTDKRQGSAACGSVQHLPGNRLFIVHSKCEEPLANNTHVEFVDLTTGKNAIQWIDLSYPPISGSLVNLTGFFEHSYSQ